MNRKLFNVICQVTDPYTWDETIPDVQSTINSALNVSVGDTPHQILYDVDKRLPYDLLFAKLIPVYNVKFMWGAVLCSRKIFLTVSNSSCRKQSLTQLALSIRLQMRIKFRRGTWSCSWYKKN